MPSGKSPVYGGSGGVGAPADVWTWTDDMAPRAGDVRNWYGMLVDAGGNHVGKAGVTVNWTLSAPGGNASLSAATSVTDATGVATVAVTYTADGAVDDVITVTGAL